MMQDLRADTDHWLRLARDRGRGCRVWRTEHAVSDTMIRWEFRLVPPDEKPIGDGDLLYP